VKLFNKVVVSIALQIGNAALVFVNQVAIIRSYGLEDFGLYQHAYALLMAAPAFLTLGIYNLASDPSFGRRAIVPSMLVAGLLAPLGLLFVSMKVVFAAFLFTCSYCVGYLALIRGCYVKRSALSGGLLNVCVLILAASGLASTATDMLLLAALVSCAAALVLSLGPLRRWKALLGESWVSFRRLTPTHYGLFAACGVLSSLTYVLPLSFAKYSFAPAEFGVAAFGLALARLPFLFTGAIVGVIAKPLAMREYNEVARLSGLLSTLGLCGTALVALNLPFVVWVAGLAESSNGILLLALYSFIGSTLWGAVDDIAWLNGSFRPEFFFKLFNVLFTGAATVVVYVAELEIHVYLALVGASTITSYYLRYVFVRRHICIVDIDVLALLAAILAVPVALIHSIHLSLAVSIPIAAYACVHVWSRETHR
jgi:O-antigen/teichoic acid export membrane protein